ADERTCFLVVGGPQGEPISEAAHFHRKLVEASLPFGGVVVNKVHFEAAPAGPDGGLSDALADALGDAELAGRVAANHNDFRALAARDRANVERLAAELSARGVIQVPYLDD